MDRNNTDLDSHILTLKVHFQPTTQGGKLTYFLNSSYNRHSLSIQPYPPRLITRDLTDFFDEFFNHQSIGDFVAMADSGVKDPHLLTRQKGMALFDKLLPVALQETLWELRGEDLCLWIHSNETVIPWSMLALQSPSLIQPAESGPFLCEAYQLTQWLSEHPEIHQFSLGRIGLLAFGDNLPRVAKERAFIHSLAGPNREVVTIEPTLKGWQDAMAHGALDAIHLCCHGKRQPESNTGVPRIDLEDGHQLTLDRLSGKARRFFTTKPFVFFNGCFSSRTTWDLGGETSWPKQFIRNGAGAVIGTHWEVDDRIACEFACRFYQAFLEGHPFGRAIQMARAQIRMADGHSWLAYTAFGDPKARVTATLVGTTSPPISKHQHQILANLNTDAALLSQIRQRLEASKAHPLFPSSSLGNITALFDLFWEQCHHRAGSEWEARELKTLTALAIVKEPVTPNMLAAFTGFSSQEMGRILKFWQPFLNSEEAWDQNHHPTIAYGFCHPLLNTFVLNKCRKISDGRVIQAAHQRIVRALEDSAPTA